MNRGQRLRAVWLLGFLLVCGGIMAYYFKLAGTDVLPGEKAYQLRAVVPTAVSLARAADVSEAGVDIGRVAEISERTDSTVLVLELDREHAPVYRDARVWIRFKSIAQENYVELERGKPEAGEVPSGGLLPIGNAQETVEIDELLSVFDETRRRDVRRILDGLGDGLRAGGSDLNRTLEAASAVPTEGAAAVQVLAGQREHVARLVDSFGRVAAALGERGDAIQLLTRRAKDTADAVAQRDEQLRATLEQLPSFVRQAGATSNRLTGFSRAATPVLRDMRLATEELVPMVEELRPAARRGRAVARELSGFSRAAVPALERLAPFSERAAEAVPPLAGFLRQVNPLLAYLAPYSREVSTFFALDAASFQATDATGHVARVLLPLSRSNAAGTLTPEQEKLLEKLNGALDTRGTNAYPAPGTAGDPTPFAGTYPRLEREAPYSR